MVLGVDYMYVHYLRLFLSVDNDVDVTAWCWELNGTMWVVECTIDSSIESIRTIHIVSHTYLHPIQTPCTSNNSVVGHVSSVCQLHPLYTAAY